jgi:hypothetical protein
MLRELRPLPLSDGEKMSTLLLLTSYARAVAAQERDLAAAAAAMSGADGVSMEHTFAALVELVTPERFPDLSALFAAGGYLADISDSADDEDFEFGLQRILDGIEYHVGQVEAGADITPPPPLSPQLELPRDKGVREAAKSRREAEKALREAQKREREAIKRALERSS